MDARTMSVYMQPLKRIHMMNRTVGTPCPLHIHNYYELELITAGSGVNRINGISFPISRGSLYMLTPTDMHQLDISAPLSLIHVAFLSDPNNGLSLPLPDGAYAAQLSEPELQSILNFFQIVAAESSSHEIYGLQGAYAALSLILIYLFRNGKQYAVTSSLKKLQPALQLIWQRCTDASLDLKHASGACELSACYFSTLFHKTFGCSFSIYLNECRLRCACYLLGETDMCIADVAYESGFSSSAHFFRVFKNRFHCTPGEYRQRHIQVPSSPNEEFVPVSLWQQDKSPRLFRFSSQGN